MKKLRCFINCLINFLLTATLIVVILKIVFCFISLCGNTIPFATLLIWGIIMCVALITLGTLSFEGIKLMCNLEKDQQDFENSQIDLDNKLRREMDLRKFEREQKENNNN
jgi:uncharacterized membrane protein (DUF106 family)